MYYYMTTSIVFNNIDYSRIEHDALSSNEVMLKDPSASIDALRSLRTLKTSTTGDSIIIPNTSGRRRGNSIDYQINTYEEYKMRRKVQVLKYKNNNNEDNLKIQFSKLSNSRGQYKMNASSTHVIEKMSSCKDNNHIRRKKGINSGINGDGTLLFLNRSIDYIDKL